MRRAAGCLSDPYVYVPALSVTDHVTAPRAATPVTRETPGPRRTKPSVRDRSVTRITALPAFSPAVPASRALVPTSDPVSFETVGLETVRFAGGAGSVAVPTANCRRIPEKECGSHWNV